VTAQAIGLQLRMYSASTPSELNSVLTAVAEQRPDALLAGFDLSGHPTQLHLKNSPPKQFG